ncbi:MAG: ferrous iron transport protein B [Eubacteriales bacterium]|nr:ferrous iron transport protein B [Eubacteriales bacterium]MDD3611654.1 ferrous iron transport protein B [Eubacteriales bacterium]
MIVALLGNQNSGKTTVFNQMTGSNQKVGNFPGVTVSKKEASLRGHPDFCVVDLPGIYSLSPYSTEEVVTRDYLVDEKPDVILNVIDTTQIERSLYLSIQLIEMNIPIVIALNMMDEIRQQGSHVHIEELSERLGVPLVPIAASRNEGIRELIDETVRVARTGQKPTKLDLCSGPAHRAIHAIMSLTEERADAAGLSSRYAATKLAERDPLIQKRLRLNENELEAIEQIIVLMEDELQTDNLAALADMRYCYLDEVVSASIHKGSGEDLLTGRLDRVLTNRFAAIPIFILLLGLVFWVAFGFPGSWLSDQLTSGMGWLTAQIDSALSASGLNFVLHSLIVDGILAGVGSVLSFLPLIALLYLMLSILEDSGYMARVAFVMDSWMRRMGISGAAIVPLIMGFGCSVPAIMSTRTLPSKRDRRLTIFMIPFISCSAKVPIYGAIASVFFPDHAGLVMVMLYLLGIYLAVMLGLILRQRPNTSEASPFIMELPPYRFPSLLSVGRNLWQKIRDFLRRAFTVILAVTVVIWFLSHFDQNLNFVSSSDDSLLAWLGSVIVPLFKPLGLSDWRIPAALISGFTAKEAVISTLAVMSGATVETLGPTLAAIFTTPSAIAFLVYVLIYTPCAAAVAAARNEFGNWRDTWIMIIFQLVAAWVVAFIFYRLALLWGISPLATIAIIVLLLSLPILLNYRAERRESRERAA